MYNNAKYQKHFSNVVKHKLLLIRNKSLYWYLFRPKNSVFLFRLQKPYYRIELSRRAESREWESGPERFKKRSERDRKKILNKTIRDDNIVEFPHRRARAGVKSARTDSRRSERNCVSRDVRARGRPIRVRHARFYLTHKYTRGRFISTQIGRARKKRRDRASPSLPRVTLRPRIGPRFHAQSQNAPALKDCKLVGVKRSCQRNSFRYYTGIKSH